MYIPSIERCIVQNAKENFTIKKDFLLDNQKINVVLGLDSSCKDILCELLVANIDINHVVDFKATINDKRVNYRQYCKYINKAALLRKINYIPRNAYNVVCGKDCTVKKWLEIMNCNVDNVFKEQVKKVMNIDINSILNKQVDDLSILMKQHVAVMTSLFDNAELVVINEAFLYFGYIDCVRILLWLKSTKKTIVWFTSDIGVAATFGDKFFVVKKDKLLHCYTREQIQKA